MRLARRVTAVVAIGAAAVLALSGCTKKNEAAPGGGTTTSGAAAGQTVKVAFVPKLQGVPYFEAMNAGGKEAAAALGNVQWLYQGPTQADAAAQADIVRSYIQQKVSTIIVAPNDPDSMAPLLQQAKDAGIHVATADTDAPNSVRDVFVNQATAEGIRKVAESIKMEGGYEAVQLRVAEQYIGQFCELAKKSNTLVLPANVADVGSMISLAMTAIKAEGGAPGGAPPPSRPGR